MMPGQMPEGPMIRLLFAAVLASALGAGSALHAQSFPNRTIKLVVPFPAGGATDNAARLVAQRLQGSLGQSVIIENQGGAGGTIGTRQATLGPAAIAWANRTALLALGDPQRALDAIAASTPVIGTATARVVPADPKDRAAWIGRTPEARDLIAFGVTEAFVEARTRLGLDRPAR